MITKEFTKLSESEFLRILDIIAESEDPATYQFGRPRLNTIDVTFSIIYKAFAGKSGRNLKNEYSHQYEQVFSSVVTHNSISRYMGDASLTEKLIGNINWYSEAFDMAMAHSDSQYKINQKWIPETVFAYSGFRNLSVCINLLVNEDGLVKIPQNIDKMPAIPFNNVQKILYKNFRVRFNSRTEQSLTNELLATLNAYNLCVDASIGNNKEGT